MSRPQFDSAISLMAIGVGNTTVQWGRFQLPPQGWTPSTLPTPTASGQVAVNQLPEQLDQGMRTAIPASLTGDTRWYVSSVSQSPLRCIQQWVAANFPKSTFHILRNEEFPLVLRLENVATVGADRLAAAVSVNLLRDPHRPAIFVDAGTAITVNALDSEGAFVGGAIFPGITTAGRALQTSTDQLPEIEVSANMNPVALGKNTTAAITSGLFWSTIGAVRELVTRVAQEADLERPMVFITGGFGPALARHLNLDATFHPQLVLRGTAVAAAGCIFD